ncbi:flagellar basal body rod protein FlgB [Parachitinimonas caeni]|uniref:Flagellar basal body rod protein FlgB n=1 Tax=Parachitinimonas caeni TaxID=3031301 RepID=A0ABT7DYI8_9NEIS|nr:flagellar basal body rod protein FlgB [Parachitinimonas caeni]MDK2125120.1 flagellar basal body rod protein FlgB [Parachitinimonas caeni]
MIGIYMIDKVEAASVGLVKMALDVASLRQQVIANNIANSTTPGFQRSKVVFEDLLGAAQQQLNTGKLVDMNMLLPVQPMLVNAGNSSLGNSGADLDMQVADVAQNAVQYQALLKALNKHMSILSVAINEGKR